MDLKFLQHVSIPEDDPIEGLKYVGEILNPFLIR